MSLRDEFRFDELQNIALDLVIDELEVQIKQLSPPTTIDQETILDLAGCALNMLRPMYRTSLMGRVYASAFQEQYQAEVQNAVQQAIQKIL